MISFSTEELQQEIDRRKQGAEENKVLMQGSDVDIGKLRAVCQKYVDTFDHYGHTLSELKMEIFYVAMETFFGGQIWLYFDATSSQSGRYVGRSIKSILTYTLEYIKSIEPTED